MADFFPLSERAFSFFLFVADGRRRLVAPRDGAYFFLDEKVSKKSRLSDLVLRTKSKADRSYGTK
jgi:hypothetical protein